MVGVREIGLPDHDQPVCAAGNEVLAVAGEVEAVDSAPVTLDGEHLRALSQVPQFSQAVLLPTRHQVASVLRYRYLRNRSLVRFVVLNAHSSSDVPDFHFTSHVTRGHKCFVQELNRTQQTLVIT